MKNFIIKMDAELEFKIKQLEQEDGVIQKSQKVINVYLDIIQRLKDFIVKYNFKNEDEEIFFFKNVKPKYTSTLFFYTQMYHIEMNCICINKESIIEYYRNEQELIQQSIKKNIEFVRYLRSGSLHLDKELYLRGRGVSFIDCKDIYYFDKDILFSTIGDFKKAKLLSNEKLLKYLNRTINALNKNTIESEAVVWPSTKITWTGKKNELIELVYAIDSSESFNWGKLSLEQLAVYIGNVFNVDLKNHARDFSEMKIRNTQTPYIDKLKNDILNRMNKLNERKRKN